MSLSFVNWAVDVFEDPVFVPTVPPGLKLDDMILVYHSGVQNRCISYDAAAVNGIIYDNILIDGKQFEISVVCCPLSFSPTIYTGRWRFDGQVYKDKTIVLTNRMGDKLIHLTGTHAEKPFKLPIRIQVHVDILRNVLTDYSDPHFMLFKKPTIMPTMNETAPPHKLVYLVGYRSVSNPDHSYRFSIVIPKKNVYNTRRNKFSTYYKKMRRKMRDKEAIIISTFLSVAAAYFPDATIIEI